MRLSSRFYASCIKLVLSIAISAVLILTGILAPHRQADADDVAGLSKTPPKEGRFVKTEQGYMTPYQMKIPGTDVEFAMEPIPGGVFTMGSPEGEKHRKKDEGPQIQVKVAPFWMGKYEVTWAQYKEFMNLYRVFKDFSTKGIRPVTAKNKVDAITAPTELYMPSHTFEFGEDPRQPAVTMTQYAARQFTKWVSNTTGHFYRLPTEAEWEYACRAGSKTAYHFGDDPAKLGEYAWFFDNTEGEMTPFVGLKKSNAWGLYDMHGNVAEWVLDEYSADGYKRFAGKTLTADQALAWPTKLYPRSIRGGRWDEDADRLRSAARLASHDDDWRSEDPNLPLSPWWFTTDPARAVGFRLLRALEIPDRPTREKYWRADARETQDDVAARLEEGRGALGVVDKDLPKAIKKNKKK